MNRSGNEFEKVFLVLGILLLIGFAVWIMKTFDVSFNAASNTVFRIIGWVIAAAGLAIWQFKSDLSVAKFATPLMLSFFWWCLYPILDYNAGVRDDFPIRMEIEWYGTAFWQFLIFLAINLIGYGIIYLLSKRDSYYY